MELRPLGHTGLRVSPIGLGTVKLGRDTGVKYPHPFQIPDDAAAEALFDTALELGINLLDTAPAYGRSEERLGRLLGPRRDRIVLCTKAGETFESSQSRFDFSPAALTASLEQSLRLLRTDRVEVLLLHSDGLVELDARAMDAAMDALRGAKAAGKVRAVGASTKTLAGVMRLLRSPVPPDVIMVTLNPGFLDDLPAIREAARTGVGVLIKKALASGHAASSRASDVTSAIAPADAVKEAMRLVLAEPGVSSVVVGTINPSHLRANVAAAAAWLGA